MNTAIFSRMVWKEYRMLRSFWIAIIPLTMAMQLLVWLTSDTSYASVFQFSIFSIMVVLYTVGAAAMIFAVEREEGTVSFLQGLPVDGGQVFRAKVLLALASVLLLAAVLGT